MAVVINLKSKLQWRAWQSEKSGRWIGVCDAMNLTMEGATLDELHSVINETIQLVLTDLLVENGLEAYLRERGWRAQGLPDRPDADTQFQVPWELIAEGARRGSARQAH